MGVKQSFSLRQWWGRLHRPVRTAILCCFAVGFFCHLFAFTNIIPNSDGISRISDSQQMTISGRWFLHYATAFNGFVQAPAAIGVLSLVFLSMSAGLAVHLLQMKNELFGALTGILMAVFPSAAYTYAYMFTAAAYFFGILLAVLAVWLLHKGRWGFVLSVPLLACAIGTYQAYLAVAVSLCLMLALLYALEGSHSAGQVFRLGLRYVLFLVLGLALYFGILKLFLWAKDLKLLSYRGISSLGQGLTPRGILSLLIFW